MSVDELACIISVSESYCIVTDIAAINSPESAHIFAIHYVNCTCFILLFT